MSVGLVDRYGSSLICDVLTAYRRDLERTPDVLTFGADDARWLRFGVRVEQWAADAQPARWRKGAVPLRPAPRPGQLLRITEQMEAAGAITLAYATLAAARRVWDTAEPQSAAQAIFRQARILRTAGATQAAENCFTYLYGFATRHRLAELRGRALVGRGILRMIGGDRRAALKWYGRARVASGHHPVVVGVSYHGEMALALGAGDDSGALIAGYKALATRALPGWDEAGVLINLAGITLRAGEAHTALQLVGRAARRSRQPRMRMGTFAKGALAAAALGRRAIVERFAARLVATAAAVNLPYEELEARSEVAEAFARIGDVAKARRWARAIQRDATREDFVSIVARCERLLESGVPDAEPGVLSAPARRVVAQLQEA